MVPGSLEDWMRSFPALAELLAEPRLAALILDPAPVLVFDRDGSLRFANRAAVTAYGAASLAELIEKAPALFGEMPEAAKEFSETLPLNGAYRREAIALSKDTETFRCERIALSSGASAVLFTGLARERSDGNLGKAVAKAARDALGMRVLVAERPGAKPGREVDTQSTIGPVRVTLDELLRTADVLSLHCPLTPATTGLIGRHELALMKPDALLINTARGALVDLEALVAALKGGDLGGAAIDVLPQEPPADGSPLFEPGIPNLIVTPHIAWAAFEARQRAVDELALNIEDFLRGGRRGRVV